MIEKLLFAVAGAVVGSLSVFATEGVAGALAFSPFWWACYWVGSVVLTLAFCFLVDWWEARGRKHRESPVSETVDIDR